MTPPPSTEDCYEIPMCSICTQSKMVECKGCGMAFCMTHRFRATHSCSEFIARCGEIQDFLVELVLNRFMGGESSSSVEYEISHEIFSLCMGEPMKWDQVISRPKTPEHTNCKQTWEPVENFLARLPAAQLFKNSLTVGDKARATKNPGKKSLLLSVLKQYYENFSYFRNTRKGFIGLKKPGHIEHDEEKCAMLRDQWNERTNPNMPYNKILGVLNGLAYHYQVMDGKWTASIPLNQVDDIWKSLLPEALEDDRVTAICLNIDGYSAGRTAERPRRVTVPVHIYVENMSESEALKDTALLLRKAGCKTKLQFKPAIFPVLNISKKNKFNLMISTCCINENSEEIVQIQKQPDPSCMIEPSFFHQRSWGRRGRAYHRGNRAFGNSEFGRRDRLRGRGYRSGRGGRGGRNGNRSNRGGGRGSRPARGGRGGRGSRVGRGTRENRNWNSSSRNFSGGRRSQLQ